jgi:hypothetical protein
MKKINLLLSNEHRNSFNNYWIVNILHDFFRVIFIEDDPVFDKTDTVIIFGDRSDIDYIKPYQEQGYKIVNEHVWNSGPADPIPGSLVLTNKNWFWYCEALYYLSVAHENYYPTKTYKKLALMPLWNQKQHRDLLFNELSDMLESLIYSYVTKGIVLPDDEMFSSSRYNHFNPTWYNDTYFSIVAETETTNDPNWFMVSEKTYKPIAFYHPFVILGQAKTLEHLHQQGFETYENLFDESYDLEYDFTARFSKVINNIRNYKPVAYDMLTQSKLEHNHNLFFNRDIVMDRLTKEIINPILEYFETKQ